MTQAEFTAFYPQFQGFTPSVVMTTYIAQANARFSSLFARRRGESTAALHCSSPDAVCTGCTS